MLGKHFVLHTRDLVHTHTNSYLYFILHLNTSTDVLFLN